MSLDISAFAFCASKLFKSQHSPRAGQGAQGGHRWGWNLDAFGASMMANDDTMDMQAIQYRQILLLGGLGLLSDPFYAPPLVFSCIADVYQYQNSGTDGIGVVCVVQCGSDMAKASRRMRERERDGYGSWRCVCVCARALPASASASAPSRPASCLYTVLLSL
ncbi:hypothetical protein CMUS01_04958 [Colletotrichum musicola]|uniref:Uncharacterized protein n=1 Tax=Colletotrichum musicola TaxID=2175873 RepID=A0A8H6KUS5_9PEZI|nr:hypothetical protein CMUS01_04958 [Colletotrichum musicola]